VESSYRLIGYSFTETARDPKLLSEIKILPKISTLRVGCTKGTNDRLTTYRRQRDLPWHKANVTYIRSPKTEQHTHKAEQW